MNRTDRLAQALDACLEQMSSHGLSAEAALAACFPTDLPADALVRLLELREALDRLPPAPDPEPAFLEHLAEALAQAPDPTRLAPGEEAIEALDATLDGEAAFASNGQPAGDAAFDPSSERSDALLELAGLAGALERLPKAENPSDGFVAELARSLAEAPSPQRIEIETASTAGPAVDSTLGMVHALEHGLEALREAGLGAAIQGQDPRVARDLAPLLALAGALRDLPAPPRPTENFRDELATSLAFAPEPSSLLRRRAARSGMGLVRRLWRSTAFTAAAAATVLIFLAAGVTYASADALPGQLLYPVKRAAESARVWLSAPDARIGLHMALADQRLGEALAVPGAAGERLADFNREVTSALVAADAAMDAGRPRQQVAQPLSVWLLDARGRLVLGRPQLPAIAWRASLALVDEAILALQTGQPLSAPVPRLFDRDDQLRVVSARPAGRIRRAPRADARVEPQPRQSDPGPIAARPVAQVPGVGSNPAPPVQPAPIDPIAAAPGGPPQQGGDDGDDEEDERSGDSRVVEPASPPPPATLELVLPSPTPPPPTQVPPTATNRPATQTPTAVPVIAPEIVKVGCYPQTIFEAGEAKCLVEARDPDDPSGEGLRYSWWVAPYQGQMIDEDQQQASYLATFNGSGFKQDVIITIEVTDADGQQVTAETTVEVMPIAQSHPGDLSRD